MNNTPWLFPDGNGQWRLIRNLMVRQVVTDNVGEGYVQVMSTFVWLEVQILKFFFQVSQPYLGWLVELASSFLEWLRRTVTSIVPRDRRPKQPRRPMEQGASRDLGRAINIKGLQGLEILPCLGVLNSGMKRMILYFNSNSCTCVKYVYIYIYICILYITFLRLLPFRLPWNGFSQEWLQYIVISR